MALDNPSQTTTNPALATDFEAMVTAIEMSADGSTGSVSVPAGESLTVVRLAVLFSFALGISSQSKAVAPTADSRFQ